MLIDIPVFICFNADHVRQAASGSRDVFGRTFTMRFDPEQTDIPALYASSYPPKPDTKFWPDNTGILFDLLPSDATDKRFLELAENSPEDYWADQDAAVRRTDELSEEHANNGERRSA